MVMKIKIFDKNELDTKSALRNASKFLKFKKVVKNFYRSLNFNDEPKLFQYACVMKSPSFIWGDNKGEDISSGIAIDEDRAKIKALGEAIERYCLSLCSKDLKKASLKELDNRALDIKTVVNFSPRQLKNKRFKECRINENDVFEWVKGYSITKRKTVFIPAQLVFVPYKHFNKEKIIREPITTGAACSTSLSGAIYRGICEIIERDAFMITYLNRLKVPLIDVENSHNMKIKNLANYFKRYRLEIYVFDITTDIKIPSVMSILIDRTGMGPAVSVGLSADLDYEKAVLKSMEEAQHSRPWIRTMLFEGKQLNKPSKHLDLDERAVLWSDIKMIRYLDFLLKNKEVKKMGKHKKYKGTLKMLKKTLEIFNKKNIEILFVDVTTPPAVKIGFKTVKVIIPQMQPLYLTEHLKYLGGRRLYEVPKLLGYRKTEIKEENLYTTIPHPFL